MGWGQCSQLGLRPWRHHNLVHSGGQCGLAQVRLTVWLCYYRRGWPKGYWQGEGETGVKQEAVGHGTGPM